ncbi:hypothetical protein [Symbioplanes lichenis]|uniref:hypothetical protein n=1 Tax=Symbioplanes lichenis TaxID=1629072 RepID=UPI0027398ECF|nr:hypothetical protein [Actinoplanes lichenis]
MAGPAAEELVYLYGKRNPALLAQYGAYFRKLFAGWASVTSPGLRRVVEGI